MATYQLKIKYPLKNQNGFNLVEVLVVISIMAFMVASIGKIISVVNRLHITSENRAKAVLLAQEPMEIINDIKNDLFACRCSVDACAGTVCTRAGDGQQCSLFENYTSCWTPYPANLAGKINFYLEKTGGVWNLQDIGASAENVPGETGFQRKITIENALRNGNGDIDTAGTNDNNTKKINITVWYPGGGRTHQLYLKNILTAWENL